jgi:hypothetical protein
MILSIKLEEIQQFLGVVLRVDERGGVETRHGSGGMGSWKGGEEGVQLER